METADAAAFWQEVRAVIDEVSSRYDGLWQKRKRVLNTKLLVLIILKIISSKNNQGYGSLLSELWDKCEERLLPQEKPISASSLCEARQKLSEEIFLDLNRALLEHRARIGPWVTWRGYRIFAVDGCQLNLPRGLLDYGYRIQDEEKRHYPQGLMSCLYNLAEGTIHDCMLVSHGDERLCAFEHMDHLVPGKDLLVFDRGYFSYLLLYRSLEKGIAIVCRLQKGTINSQIRTFWESDETDCVIDYYPSAAVRSDLRKRGYYLEFKPLQLRLIKYTIGTETYICATTLLQDEITVEDFAMLYHGRWGIEELYKISKQLVQVEEFHSQTERGVKQEVYAHVLLINLARLLELNANLPSTGDKHTAGSHWQSLFFGVNRLKINFKNCLLTVSRLLYCLFLMGAEAIKTLIPKAISSVARIRQRVRPGRCYPRASLKPKNKWMVVQNRKVANAFKSAQMA